jgi:hypothetical protein
MYKAQGSLTWLQVAEVRHSIERSDGFTNSRDCTKEAPTGSQGMAGEFAVVRSQEALLDFTYRGGRHTLRTMHDSGMVAGDAKALIRDEFI